MLQESLRAMTELRNNETPKGEIKKSAGKSKSAKWIKPLAENFKRTLKGFALVRQETRKLLQQQTHSFPLKSMVDAEGTTVRYGVEGEVRGIALDSLLHKAPHFFSYYFRDVRKKLDYGARVQRWLCSVTCLASFLWNFGFGVVGILVLGFRIFLVFWDLGFGILSFWILDFRMF